MKVVLYSTHCPKCNVLTQKLNSKGIQFEEVNDVDVMQSLGIKTVPMLEIDGKIMDFGKATQWVNNIN